ncbi:hypothetical protein SacRon12I_09015 [Sulfolobus acidocaldarius Ron12/I]|uniref:Uncharacterized protein n=1 Tax=Sulfolobus acidocaldarius Ron12/I TaxID=1028567 RepID=M1J027_9CREN|nr:hypothetical protein SacRon12I_09015 [Sulfolobus acidocaldarius Ron12/I]
MITSLENLGSIYGITIMDSISPYLFYPHLIAMGLTGEPTAPSKGRG